MSNFNQYFVNTGAEIIVKRFFHNVDIYSPNNKILTLKHYIVDEPDRPAAYYVENKLTKTHKVRIEYTTSKEPDEIKYSEFEVPKEINGAFIIGGAYRISTNRLSPDYDCRINMSGTGEFKINFDYDRQYLINKRVIKIRRIDPETGVIDRPLEISIDNLETALNNPSTKELLKLTERQGKKWAVKLDLDYVPEYITTKLIDECLAFGDDRLHDLIIDKRLESVPASFMHFLFKSSNGRNYINARRNINNYYTKYGKLQEELNPITTLCNRFWKGTADSDKSSEIQVPPGVNSMNLGSLSSKVHVPPSVAFNSTFTDLIDIADTPINGNTNIQNALTVSCHITDTQVLFDVFSLEFQKITIDYLDYLNKKVCASEYVDYENNKIVPNKDGEVEVKYRMKRRMVPVSEVDLVDLHPDYRLSSITRRIPFVNYTDSVRISMGTSMLKQSIPIVHAERALVDTGNNDELTDNVLTVKFDGDSGVIEEITDNKVVIKHENGETSEVLRQTAIQSINDVAVYTEPKVKVGQKIKRGDIVTGAVGHESDTYKAGVNTLVLFHAYHGLVNEDALVISESYADKVASYSIIDLTFDVRNSSAIKWIAPIGTKVKSKDNIITLYKAIRLDEINRTLNEKLGGFLGNESSISEYTIEESLKIPNNIEDATISDIMIQENTNPAKSNSGKPIDTTFTKTSEKVISEYVKAKDRSTIYTQYPEYVAADVLRPILLDEKSYKVVYTIRVRLIKYSRALIGEKITSRYGGKGVVSKIVKDSDMPKIVDAVTGEKKICEVIMNPYSTINRKIPSVIMETSLGLIAHRLFNTVEVLKRTKTGQKKIIPLLSKYYPGRFDAMSPEEFIKLHNDSKIEEVYYFNVGCFSSFTPEKINAWMEELKVTTQFDVLMPEVELADTSELKEVLSPEEYEEVMKSMSDNFVKVDKPLMAGYMTLERLQHIPSYSNKVTTSLYGVDVSAKWDEPILGKGKYRQTGQKIGEMELAVLLSRNADAFLKDVRKDTAKSDNQTFLNNLLGLGLTVTDSKGYNQGGSSLKGQLERMKTKFRLKNSR